ncbi:TPA: hypothetical protein H1005_02475 [archaeon]|nr:hypothetical protein [Candidatus Naiadarchaeales archaeon SRR2090153.bin1042]
MAEVHIRTAAIILTIVAVFTIAGTYFALTRAPPGPFVTGFQTGTTTVNVSETISISLPQVTVSFENMDVSTTNNTDDDKPKPFVVRNDGNTNVNVTCYSGSIWATDASPTDNYQYNSTMNETSSLQNNIAGENLFGYRQMPTSAQKCVGQLKFATANDQATINVNLSVPSTEGAGNKTATVTLTASAS